MKRFENFTFLINKIYRDIQKIKLFELKKYGLKGSHMMCLYHLGREKEKLPARARRGGPRAPGAHQPLPPGRGGHDHRRAERRRGRRVE